MVNINRNSSRMDPSELHEPSDRTQSERSHRQSSSIRSGGLLSTPTLGQIPDSTTQQDFLRLISKHKQPLGRFSGFVFVFEGGGGVTRLASNLILPLSTIVH